MKTLVRVRTCSLFIVALTLCGDRVATAEQVVTIRNNGRNENVINLVILGDGYISGEMLKYAADVDLFVADFFRQNPYAEYSTYFNVHRIDVVSNETGADHPETNSFRDTAFGARYNCNNFQRLICIDYTAVNDVLVRSIGPEARDLVVVLVNDTVYGGSGGRFAVASKHPLTVEIMLHEIGHSLGLLSDEYEADGCSVREGINSTQQTEREKIPWNYWIDAGTATPTIDLKSSVPGLYQGSSCRPDFYRPTYNSKMRVLGRPFDQINTERLIKRFYNVVAPIQAVIPGPGDLGTVEGTLQFLVGGPQPVGRQLLTEWFVDGRPAGNARMLELDTSTLASGTHAVDVEVRDTTAAVRQDLTGALTSRIGWTFKLVSDVSTATIRSLR